MKYGLNIAVIKKIQVVFCDFPNIEKVILYGSRALGTYKNGSDIDLTLKGNLSFGELLRVENSIEDLLLPYQFDLSRYEQLSEEKLLEHIDHFGKVFYEKDTRIERLNTRETR